MSISSALFSLADNGNAASLASRYRARRFQLFAGLLHALPATSRILDVGGTPHLWLKHRSLLPNTATVTLFNSEQVESAPTNGMSFVQGDARDLSRYADGEFDICFSNSLIEHFPSLSEQQTVAHEIRRVARSYFVQTPNKYFPLEPHFLIPGWQFMPVRLRAFVLRRCSLGWIPRARNEEEARSAVTGIRLLSGREFHALFPDATISRETVGPLTKSWIAMRRYA